MKKYVFLLLLLVAVEWSAMAAGHSLRLSLKDGTTKVFNLSDKPVVTFSGEDMTIETADVTSTCARSEVASMTFGEAAAVIDAVADETVYSYDGRVFSCPGHDIVIYALNGNKIVTGHDEVSLEALQAGVYIITANNQSFKVIKK
ncbi:MAG: T9SS type A sorting domain-containing protein [Muribaculaceae bacterium]